MNYNVIPTQPRAYRYRIKMYFYVYDGISYRLIPTLTVRQTKKITNLKFYEVILEI